MAGGKTTGLYLKIYGKDLETFDQLRLKGELFCVTCKRVINEGRVYYLSQMTIVSKHIQVNVVCDKCAEPIQREINNACKREQAQPVPQEAVAAHSGGGS